MSSPYPGYRVGGIHPTGLAGGIYVAVCERCGALVGSIPDHNAWHDDASDSYLGGVVGGLPPFGA